MARGTTAGGTGAKVPPQDPGLLVCVSARAPPAHANARHSSPSLPGGRNEADPGRRGSLGVPRGLPREPCLRRGRLLRNHPGSEELLRPPSGEGGGIPGAFFATTRLTPRSQHGPTRDPPTGEGQVSSCRTLSGPRAARRAGGARVISPDTRGVTTE